MTSDLPFHALTALATRLRSGATTSRAIVEACLARIAADDTRVHAFIETWPDDALRAADASDLERAAGFVRGPLHGLPIALKDLLHMAGRATTAGSASWRGRVSTTTATAVQRLLAAGMVPIGKTHMVEFAFGGWGRNQPMGAPRNPWDPDEHRVAGGSSSGSAAAVAAGMVPVAIGSDTGGSVRIPAALCGLTGLKTTYGLISLHGVVPLSTTLDSLGPLTHTVEDAALLTAAMAGPDPGDPATWHAPPCRFDDVLSAPPDLKGVRIAAQSSDQFPASTDPGVAAAFDDAVATLRSLGAIVDEVHVPLDFDDMMLRNGRLIAAEAFALHRAYVDDASLPIDPWVRRRLQGGRAITAADYIDELAHRRAMEKTFADWMRGRAALLTPTLPITAEVLDRVDESTTPLAAFTRAANYLGACALTLPAGLVTRAPGPALPVGVQLIGAAFTEATLVAIGRGFQGTTDWHLRRPPAQPAYARTQ